jgi:hypothetical protein
VLAASIKKNETIKMGNLRRIRVQIFDATVCDFRFFACTMSLSLVHSGFFVTQNTCVHEMFLTVRTHVHFEIL